ncbi:MAG: sugar phosphate isomerase/epimerase [Planctomycetia bacterium]|jgi:sugar phosphate isomerase/epimerase|nr:sugar phosphate isomerase/epimerase [Planctomycetia bacterium]
MSITSTRFTRRQFGQIAASLAAVGGSRGALAAPADSKPLFKISLAEWSLHRTIFSGSLDNLDFPREAKRTYGIEAVEYVNQFFKDKAKDYDYLTDLSRRAGDEGVQNLLIMCDGLGKLGDPDAKARTQAIENHFPWAEAAKRLGCHSIRVNASSAGSFAEQQKLAADGLSRLAEYAGQFELNVIVENHGGLSSNGSWLAGVMRQVNLPNCGTLPDFGNFHDYDRYQGVEELLPFAKGVSAKSHDFDAAGNETKTDYMRMLKLVLAAGYHGHVGVEYEGKALSESEGIQATKALLERVRDELAA